MADAAKESANSNVCDAPAADSCAKSRRLRRILLVVHSVLITLIVLGSISRAEFPFIYNPLESLYSDPQRHYHNAFDVKGEDLESILNAPGFEIYLSTLVRIIGHDRTLHSLAMAILSLLTPWIWYRWFRELTRDKTISLFGYAIMTFLPSWFRIFGYFMDSVILLPLTGAGLWLTWRAARKLTWPACLLAAVFCGAACATKSVALPVVVLPWAYVGYKFARQYSWPVALKMVALSVGVLGSIFAIGPLKVWAHTGAFVLLPDGLYNQRYFESGAHDIQVTNSYNRTDEGEYVSVSIWASSSVCYPPFYPFSEWMSSRTGRCYLDMDYKHGRDYIRPIKMSLKDRLRFTLENIIFFFFEYQWPEDNDYRDPFPRNIHTMARFVWLPLTILLVVVTLSSRRKEFVGWYFIAVTLAYMFQQSAVMEGRYKKLWEGVAIGTFLSCVAASKTYKHWRMIDSTAEETPAQTGMQIETRPAHAETTTTQTETPPAQAETTATQTETPPAQTETTTTQTETPPALTEHDDADSNPAVQGKPRQAEESETVL